jgi:hypothetical protein
MKDVQDRIKEFEDRCKSMQIAFRSNDEAVAIVVPKRNIETWIHYLDGKSVNEIDKFPKLDREHGCKLAVDYLVRLCKTTGIKPDAPPALAEACKEYNRIRVIQ